MRCVYLLNCTWPCTPSKMCNTGGVAPSGWDQNLTRQDTRRRTRPLWTYTSSSPVYYRRKTCGIRIRTKALDYFRKEGHGQVRLSMEIWVAINIQPLVIVDVDERRSMKSSDSFRNLLHPLDLLLLLLSSLWNLDYVSPSDALPTFKFQF